MTNRSQKLIKGLVLECCVLLEHLYSGYQIAAIAVFSIPAFALSISNALPEFSIPVISAPPSYFLFLTPTSFQASNNLLSMYYFQSLFSVITMNRNSCPAAESVLIHCSNSAELQNHGMMMVCHFPFWRYFCPSIFSQMFLFFLFFTWKMTKYYSTVCGRESKLLLKGPH